MTTPKVYVELFTHTCLWCLKDDRPYQWRSILVRPSVCPNCHRTQWDRPRRRKGRSKNDPMPSDSGRNGV